ncbi:NAD(P)-dependent dehydrogenase (short-subunit alcohol dehydrogenase family) [Catenuloplanes nepalensis]|uniref:NAD(P)-dependent dehydrogenase (Short-subunit alcohol dehydrogenase family) n=1 Tax=Catenuloplanes nepalensis TaxID=587533 RepID=A0ABT9MLV9_9ACTN|nr:SDR family NAD(P)-dependent oxidoreductase [Catenuloplanes nepalensis]MDP9792316.1 NAD(P)-dependent dehydrogenase (short-subunit alcohol dehydrogenase family) [Catenuloplanes nepalensis]
MTGNMPADRRIAVVTGAAGGLGQATAQRLLAAGLDVVAVTRDARGAEATRRSLQDRAGGGVVHALHADLLRRDDVDALGERLRGTVPRVDVLINNAGAAFPDYATTADGAERTHALNHLAPFRLTHLLLASGLFAADARIIAVSSDLVSRARLDTGDPDVTGTGWHDRFSQLTVYGTAKLIGLLATAALAARLPAGMRVHSANPGVLRTGFHAKAGGPLKAIAAVGGLFAASPEKAAHGPVLLATAATPPVPSGGLLVKGRPATPPAVTRDAALTTEVYERTARALGIAPISA